MTFRKTAKLVIPTASWSYKNPFFGSFYDPHLIENQRQCSTSASSQQNMADRHNESSQSSSSSSSFSTSSSKNDAINQDDNYIDRSSRLAAVFACLFILTLILSISFITVLAILSDGFANLFNGQNWKIIENSEQESTTIDEATKASHRFVQTSYNGTCLTNDCILLSAHYLNNMNSHVNPCDNFYDFACGKYQSSKFIDQSAFTDKISILNDMKKRMNVHIRDLLESSQINNITRALKLTQIYYDSCMDEASKDEFGVQPLMSLISTLGGWSLLTNARFESIDFQWESLAGHLSFYGADGLFKVFVHSSIDNPMEHTLTISPPRLFLEKKKFYREVLSSNVFLQYYRQYIIQLLDLLGVDMEDESGVIEYQVDDIIDFERKIANITRVELSTSSSLSDANMHQMSFGDFKKKYHQINWDAYFNEDMISYMGRARDSMPINVIDVHYFDNLPVLLKSKPHSSINNLLMWRLVTEFDGYLPSRYRQPIDKFRYKMFGISQNAATSWSNCVEQVKKYLATPLSSEFVRKHFSPKHREAALNITTDLKKAMEITILNADWIDESTREAALNKLDKTNYKIGYPDEILNETHVLQPYAGVRLTANKFFENTVSLRKCLFKSMMSKLHTKLSLNDWSTSIIFVDAFHDFSRNEIVFPASILQFPMFTLNGPKYTSYASIGMGIGHELTHGFDDIGAKYDGDGRLRGWWHSDTMSTFQNKKQCFIAQYGNKVEEKSGKKMNGKTTLRENIADNGGLRVAFQAYQLKLERDEEDHHLPGFTEFTREQMFFISFANTWCESIKPDSLDRLIDTDLHSLGSSRVNVPLQNFPAFSKAFDCPIGSPMNPFEKCRIW